MTVLGNNSVVASTNSTAGTNYVLNIPRLSSRECVNQHRRVVHRDVLADILESVRSGYYTVVLMSPPCSTFSRARWPVLRTRDFLYGVRGLSPAQRRQVHLDWHCAGAFHRVRGPAEGDGRES